MRTVAILLVGVLAISCGRREAPRSDARNLLLVTIDTLRADHVGAYGYPRSQAAFVDLIGPSGAIFERAYAAAPITLTSHATILTGRYPPGHGARDNGIAMMQVPTLATELHAHGFKTAAFVAAFPLDHQFGLARGFGVYSDRMPRGSDGRLQNERPAAQVVDEAINWLGSVSPPAHPASPALPAQRFFLWIHVFEPHAPYGNPSDRRPVLERYDDEIGVANRELLRVLNGVGDRGDTLIIVAGDHGEAFGEHGEYSHSIFVYDTTLRVPLVMSGPGVPARARGDRAGTVVSDAVTLADIAPTAMRLLGFTFPSTDGIDLSPVFGGSRLPNRELYAESFAPLVEFGWAPLRAIRSPPWKFIAAPKPELFDLEKDADEQRNVVAAHDDIARSLDRRANTYADAALPAAGGGQIDSQASERLRALGYAGRSRQDTSSARPDPKDRRELAARIAQVTSGELQGGELLKALEAIVTDDPRNGQAHLRLGYAQLEAGDCARAEQEFHAAIATGLPSADAHIGLVTCLGRRGDLSGAERALEEARRLEPDSPVVFANLGILRATRRDYAGAIDALATALSKDPGLDEARFNLAVAYLKAGRRAEAASTARELLARLRPDAPQRREVERLLRAAEQH